MRFAPLVGWSATRGRDRARGWCWTQEIGWRLHRVRAGDSLQAGSGDLGKRDRGFERNIARPPLWNEVHPDDHAAGLNRNQQGDIFQRI